jgi:hypothetical protein
MEELPVNSQPSKAPIRWLSILQLAFSALAAVFALGAAFTVTVTAIIQVFAQGVAAANPTESFMIAASLAFAGVLAIPSAWCAWQHLSHPEFEPAPWQEPRNFVLILTIVVIIVTGLALLLGDWASTRPSVSWFLLPVLNLVANGLPAFWVIYVGTRRLIPGKPSRRWGVFITGFIFSPLLILVIELILLIGVGILALIWVMLTPSLANQLQGAILQLQTSGGNPDVLLPVVLPFLLNPVILVLVFAYISVLVPMIEETLKPLGVWLLIRQKLTPAQGFAYGVLGGAGFGLFENLGNTSGGGDTWALLAAARISTVLLHSLTAGLIGWGLVSAWRYKRYLRLAAAYLFAITMHGLWNGLAILTFLASLEGQTNVPIPTTLVQLGSLSTVVIFGLGAFNLVFFIGFSNTLRRTLKVSPPPAPSGLQLLEVDNAPGLSPIVPSPDEGNDQPEDASNHGGENKEKGFQKDRLT